MDDGTQETQTDESLVAAALGSASVKAGRVVEWGGKRFELRRATLGQQRRLAALAKTKEGGQDEVKLLVHTLIQCVYNPDTGKRVFNEKHEESLLQLDSGPGGLIDTFMKAAKAMNAEEADIEKNSETAPTDKQS